MTVIAIAADATTIAIAADREWSDDSVRFSRNKLTRIHAKRTSSIVGAVATCGDARTGAMLEERITAVVRAVDAPETLLPALQKAVDAFRDDYREMAQGSAYDVAALLIAYGRGFAIDAGWYVMEIAFDGSDLGVCAIGNGAPIALGAMWALIDDGYDAKEIARWACEAAAELTTTCAAPIDIVARPRAQQ